MCPEKMGSEKMSSEKLSSKRWIQKRWVPRGCGVTRRSNPKSKLSRTELRECELRKDVMAAWSGFRKVVPKTCWGCEERTPEKLLDSEKLLLGSLRRWCFVRVTSSPLSLEVIVSGTKTFIRLNMAVLIRTAIPGIIYIYLYMHRINPKSPPHLFVLQTECAYVPFP